MYKLYWHPGTAAFGPQAVLEEAGLPYQIEPVDLAAGAQRHPEFLAINPMGKVPALLLPEGQILYEAAAIMLYLSDHHGLLDLAPAAQDPQRGLFLRSLFFLCNNVQDEYKRFYYPDRSTTEPADAPRIKARAAENLLKAWRPVDDHLAARGPYHLGESYSLADIYLVMLVTWFVPPEDLLARYPAIERCFNLVCARPAIRRSLERQKVSA